MKWWGDEALHVCEPVTATREQHLYLLFFSMHVLLVENWEQSRWEVRRKALHELKNKRCKHIKCHLHVENENKKRSVSIWERAQGSCSRRALQGSLYCQVISPRAIVGLILCTMIPNAVPCCPAGEHSSDHLLWSVSMGWGAAPRSRWE